MDYVWWNYTATAQQFSLNIRPESLQLIPVIHSSTPPTGINAVFMKTAFKILSALAVTIVVVITAEQLPWSGYSYRTLKKKNNIPGKSNFSQVSTVSDEFPPFTCFPRHWSIEGT